MDKLEEKFAEIIDADRDFTDGFYRTDVQECVQLTLDMMAGFAEWSAKNLEYHLIKEIWLDVHTGQKYTTDQLIQEYLKTL